jgi:hypothetical protein
MTGEMTDKKKGTRKEKGHPFGDLSKLKLLV